MRKLITAAALAAFTLTTVAAAPAGQAPDGYQFDGELKKGETLTHIGDAGTGGTTALSLFGLNVTDPAECGEASDNKCDKGLVKVTGSGTFEFFLEAAYHPADFDVAVFESDEAGNLGEEVASSGNFYAPVPVEEEGLAPYEAGTFEAKTGYYAVVVYYYAAGGGYTIDLTLS